MGFKLRISPSGGDVIGTANGDVLVWNDAAKEWDPAAAPSVASAAQYGWATPLSAAASSSFDSAAGEGVYLPVTGADWIATVTSDFEFEPDSCVLTYVGSEERLGLAQLTLTAVSTGDETIGLGIAENDDLLAIAQFNVFAMNRGAVLAKTGSHDISLACNRIVGLTPGATFRPAGCSNIAEAVTILTASLQVIKLPLSI